MAINLDDAPIPDNEENQPIDKPIHKDGQPAYFSTLPIKAMVKEIRVAGLPASLSNTAGTYVCNHIMYGVLYYIQKSFPGMKGGFIHVPYIPQQVVNRPNTLSMSYADIAKGLEAAIKAIDQYKNDISSFEGSVF